LEKHRGNPTDTLHYIQTGHRNRFRVANNQHLRNARIKVALRECIKIVRVHNYIYFYHITEVYIKKQFKSIFDFFSIYLFITLAFNPLKALLILLCRTSRKYL